jgi:3-phosphoshikimate 1-carboxyvinyltransferase
VIETVRRARRLSGAVQLPGDKSISHRYAMLAAIAVGASEFERFAGSQDCRSTLACLQALGVPLDVSGSRVRIEGLGLRGLCPPSTVLDAQNSGTTMRLLSGILAGQSFGSTISGDASLSRRPMGRIMEPLRRMGAEIHSEPGDLPPLRIRGGKLSALRYELPVASAQVKSCVLLAGLYADGPTAVRELVPTRDHTEIALSVFGADVRRDGDWVEVLPGPLIRGCRLAVPGDLSGSAFFLVAAAVVPGADVVFPAVGLNRRRRELLDYLDRAGLHLEVADESSEGGEPRGDLRVRYRPELLAGTLPPIQGPLVPALIDEIPVLAVLGACLAGGLEVRDAKELRVKESDRIAAVVQNLRAMGAGVEERPDGFLVAGGDRLKGADIETHGDHRIAMAFAVAGLVADGETRIHNAGCADVSFPGFWRVLAELAGQAGHEEP